MPDFNEYLSRQTPLSHSSNPWAEVIWKQVTNGCPWDNNDTQANYSVRCDQYTSLASLPSIYQPDRFSTRLYDCITVYAQAMHNLLMALCPSATEAAARQCIAANNLYKFIVNGSFQSTHGPLMFDELGNSMTSYYFINHYRQRPNTSIYESIVVGQWFRQNTSLFINTSLLNWAKYNQATNLTITASFLRCLFNSIIISIIVIIIIIIIIIMIITMIIITTTTTI